MSHFLGLRLPSNLVNANNCWSSLIEVILAQKIIASFLNISIENLQSFKTEIKWSDSKILELDSFIRKLDFIQLGWYNSDYQLNWLAERLSTSSKEA